MYRESNKIFRVNSLKKEDRKKEFIESYESIKKESYSFSFIYSSNLDDIAIYIDNRIKLSKTIELAREFIKEIGGESFSISSSRNSTDEIKYDYPIDILGTENELISSYEKIKEIDESIFNDKKEYERFIYSFYPI